MAEVDWDAIKVDYISGMSQSQVAKKYGVPRGTVSTKCIQQGWTKDRKRCQAKAKAKVADKIAVRIAAEQTQKLGAIMDANSSMSRVLSRITEQLESLESAPVKNLRDMSDLAKAISMTADTMMRLYGIPTQSQQHTQHMAEERLRLDQARLELEQSKAASGLDDGEGVEIRIIAPGEDAEADEDG